MFSSELSGSLFVCQQDKAKTTHVIFKKLCGKVAHEENHYILVVIWITLS